MSKMQMLLAQYWPLVLHSYPLLDCRSSHARHLRRLCQNGAQSWINDSVVEAGASITSAILNTGVCLLEDNNLVFSQILEVIPIMHWTVVYPFILGESVMIYYIHRNAFGAAIDSPPIAQCQWPVVTRPLKRLPNAA
jgi:hypothetical protein